MWWMIPMVASMGFQWAGAMAQTQGMVTGSKSQAKIEKISRDYQTKVFQEGYKKQLPFMQAGKEAIPLYQKALGGEAEETGIGAMGRGLVEQETSSMSDYVKGLASKRLEAAAPEKTKGRLMDIMQIGLGQSGSAGQSAINLGANLARSQQTGGAALAQATMAQNIGRQNMYMGAVEQLSGLPAYMAMRPGGSTQAPISTYGSVSPVAPQSSMQTRPQMAPMLY